MISKITVGGSIPSAPAVAQSLDELIQELKREGVLKTPRIAEAFLKIDRVDFVPEAFKDEAYINAPLPIGFGQTISQPLTVAYMIELLEPEPGEKILDVGAGSGWTSALLAHIISEGGKPLDKAQGEVFAIERIPELCEFGRANVSKYDFLKSGRVDFRCADGSKGIPEEAPFDGILASASARELPNAWKEQVKIGGRIVTPIGASVWLFIKKDHDRFDEIEHPGFAFVPLVEDS